ncbi:MAG: hypothetical protein CR986_06075 [Ignavibacteriae bacterium]|nr:MAG: hypothetical protein CR986_06075 [Ignavibacteriota bacterium]
MNKQSKKLYDTLKNDISDGGFTDDVHSDFEELKEYYLNEERKKELSKMSIVKKYFLMTWWLLQELLLNLTPARRLLLLLGILILPILNFKVGNFGLNTSFIGSIIILFVLMLELKDKLLAKDELNVGNSVQEALMPEKNPKISGWDVWLFTKPAKEVGGDLVDIIKLKDKKYGITIADVSGKGLGAALLMAKLQTIIRTLAPENSKLDLLFRRVNNAFYRDILPNSFASAIFLEIEENGNSISYVNAGHLPPIIIQDRQIKELPKGNMALGLSKEVEFDNRKIAIEPNEYFVAFSDGVTEAKNKNGQFLGLNSLKIMLKESVYHTSDQLGNKILNYVKSFIGNSKTADDLSIVIIKKKNAI